MAETTEQNQLATAKKTELVRAEIPVDIDGMAFSNLEAVYRFGQYVIASGMFPQFNSANQIVMAYQVKCDTRITLTQALQFIGLSNDTLTETSASTTLSNEIAANGLSRALATTITHTAGTNTTTLAKTFQCTTAPQAAQKAALFNQSSNGTMNHVLAFTQRSLQVGDQLTVSFVITLG